jgi:hypothetical protein
MRILRKARVGLRKLRNRAGRFAFMGGKRVKSYNVRRTPKMQVQRIKKSISDMSPKANTWIKNHPNMAMGAAALTAASAALLIQNRYKYVMTEYKIGGKGGK